MAIGIVSISYAKAQKEVVPDVRILIDISGSMKKNDPKNLRVPATKLLLNLLPKGSKAGVWLFGSKTKQLIGLGKVNDKWLDTINRKVKHIHSRGQYTNIADALATASKDWEVEKNVQRVIIILTDGFVDVSKDKKKSVISRNRILEKMVPELNKKKVKIYTVALSKNADVDLSKKMALGTDGFFKQINRAEQLEKTFVKVFEAAVVRDVVPIAKGGEFMVDKKTNEFTLMAFKMPNKGSLKIRTPKGKLLTQKSKPANVKWQHEKHYDLVTVKRPETGMWQMVSGVDKDNRVYIVTDLKLRAKAFPSNIFLFEDFTYQARLTEKGKTITKRSFLEVVNVFLKKVNADMTSEQWKLLDNGEDTDKKAQDGRYTKHIAYLADTKVGAQELLLTAIGPTFQRNIRQVVNVHESPVHIDKYELFEEKAVEITIRSNQDLIKPKTVSINVTIADRTGKSTTETLVQRENLQWLIEVPVPAGQTRIVTFVIKGETVSGRKFSVTQEPILLEGEKIEEPPPPPPPPLPPEPEPPLPPVEDDAFEEEANDMESVYEEKKQLREKTGKSETPVKKEKPVDYQKIFVVVIVSLLYLLVLAVLFKFGMQWLRKKKMAAIKDKLG